MILKSGKLPIKIKILKKLISKLRSRSLKDGRLNSDRKLLIMNKLFKISLVNFNNDNATFTKIVTKR